MARIQITKVGNSAALLLPEEFLSLIGIHLYDEVDVELADRKLIMRSLNEAERHQKIDEITNKVFERRKSAYKRLAEGV